MLDQLRHGWDRVRKYPHPAGEYHSSLTLLSRGPHWRVLNLCLPRLHYSLPTSNEAHFEHLRVYIQVIQGTYSRDRNETTQQDNYYETLAPQI